MVYSWWGVDDELGDAGQAADVGLLVGREQTAEVDPHHPVGARQLFHGLVLDHPTLVEDDDRLGQLPRPRRDRATR